MALPAQLVLHYSQIKYLEKFSIFWCFGEEFLHYDEILIKNANYLVDYMVYASLLGKSLFLSFGKGFPSFRKIFTPGSSLIEFYGVFTSLSTPTTPPLLIIEKISNMGFRLG